MSLIFSIDAKAYRNTASYATPTFQEIINLQDVGLKGDKETVDVTVRGANGWSLKVGTLKNAEITIGMIYDTESEDFTEFLDAYLNNTPIELLLLDKEKTVTGAQGLRAICDVTSFELPQPLNDVFKANFTLIPTYNNAGTDGAFVPPEWVTMPLT